MGDPSRPAPPLCCGYGLNEHFALLLHPEELWPDGVADKQAGAGKLQPLTFER